MKVQNMCIEFKYLKINFTSLDISLKFGEQLVTASHIILN